jgi:hypothetical protein
LLKLEAKPMMPYAALDEEFFAKVLEFDQRVAAAVAERRCSHCGGPLHRSNYRRKPRGGLIAEAGEAFAVRLSLCCGREGCRKRVHHAAIGRTATDVFRQNCRRDAGLKFVPFVRLLGCTVL